jgi:transcriptional regulator with XRE-family HTH domain
MQEPVRQTETRRIGRQLRLIREKSGRSVGQLAEAAGLSERAVRELEAGRTNPSLMTVVSIVDALGVTLDEVVAAARRNRPVASYTPASASNEDSVELSAELPDARMRARLVRAGGDSPTLPTGPMFGHVLAGRVNVTLDGEQTALAKGDSFHAQASVLQSWRAPSPSGLLLVVEMPKAGEEHPGPRSETSGA